MFRPLVAAIAATALAAAGCGRPWPQTTPAKADPAFAARQRPVTVVDVLPLDLEVWTQPGQKQTPDQLRAVAEAGLMGALSEQLLQRGYIVGTTIGWDGQFVQPDGQNAQAMAPDAVLATVDSLASYGLAAQVSPGLPVPFLPSRLGEQTHADATLYIGGWTFAGDDHSTGNKIAKGILIAVAIVGVIVILAALSKGKGGDGLGKAGGAAVRGVGKAAASMGRMAARAALHAGNLTVHVARGMARNADDVLRATADVLDAWGRSGTHITVFTGPRPVWSQRPGVPHSGHSRTYLELTLVDNTTGLVLWHTQQQFPTHAGNEAKAKKILASMMASLPIAGKD